MKKAILFQKIRGCCDGSSYDLRFLHPAAAMMRAQQANDGADANAKFIIGGIGPYNRRCSGFTDRR